MFHSDLQSKIRPIDMPAIKTADEAMTLDVVVEERQRPRLRHVVREPILLTVREDFSLSALVVGLVDDRLDLASPREPVSVELLELSPHPLCIGVNDLERLGLLHET